MADLASATEEELIEALQRLRDSRPECTGIAAQWCPVHGTCTCSDDEGNRWIDDLDADPSCPLHGRKSLHCGVQE